MYTDSGFSSILLGCLPLQIHLQYYYMAISWTIIIFTSALAISFFQYRNERNLYRITQVTGLVKLVRNGEEVILPQDELVPGDVVVVETGNSYCDAALVESATKLVDEIALTGEANPIAKTALDAAEGRREFRKSTHKHNLIMAGTSILESEGSKALVLRTASFTARGELLRDIYSYSRNDFKFDVEIPIVITILFFYAIFGFAMVVYFIKESPVYAWFYGM